METKPSSVATVIANVIVCIDAIAFWGVWSDSSDQMWHKGSPTMRILIPECQCTAALTRIWSVLRRCEAVTVKQSKPCKAANLQQGRHCVGLSHEHLTLIIIFLHQNLFARLSLTEVKQKLASKHSALSRGLLVKVNELRESAQRWPPLWSPDALFPQDDDLWPLVEKDWVFLLLCGNDPFNTLWLCECVSLCEMDWC